MYTGEPIQIYCALESLGHVHRLEVRSEPIFKDRLRVCEACKELYIELRGRCHLCLPEVNDFLIVFSQSGLEQLLWRVDPTNMLTDWHECRETVCRPHLRQRRTNQCCLCAMN